MPRTLLVTGTSRGLGRALAVAALEAGHRVVATARSADAVADLVSAHPDSARAVALDVRDPQAAAHAVRVAAAVGSGRGPDPAGRATQARGAGPLGRAEPLAATEEFSDAGLAGGRVGRIAERARANQRMIYAYFGSKDGLFEKVLQAQAAVQFDAEDLPGYACQVFDFYRANPRMVRLNLWQALERPDLPQSPAPVARAMADKVAGIAAAQASGAVSSVLPAAVVLDLILAMTYGNIAQARNAAAWPDSQRSALALAVGRLTSGPGIVGAG